MKMPEVKLKLRALLNEPIEDAEFVRWLNIYLNHSKEALNGKHHQEITTDHQRRDIIRDLSRFVSDQKAVEWANAQRITLQKGVFWWWLNPDNRTGYIHGLDNSRGVPRITNGINVWIERGDGTIFLGHRDYLIYDRKPRQTPDKKETAKAISEDVKPVAKYLPTAEDMIKKGTVQAFLDKYLNVMGSDSLLKKEEVEVFEPKYLSHLIAQYIEKLTSI